MLNSPEFAKTDFLCLDQGNCHRCLVPKRLLDELEQNFAARTKENMFEAINNAIFKGVYPGWLADRKKSMLEKNPDLDVDSMSIHPRELLKKDGTLVKERAAIAASRLGRHLVVGFFDDLEGLDPHSMVHDPMHIVLMCTYDCTDYILNMCSLGWTQCIL